MDKISTITLPDGTKYRLSDNDAQLIKDTVGWTGKNLLVQRHIYNNYASNGITWNTNADGSISANGTATSASVIDLVEYSNPLNPPTGEYILSGGINQNQYIYVNGCKNGAYVNIFAEAKGTDVKFAYPSTYDVDGFKVSVRINSGQTVNNLTFYPMLRKADVTDPTYEPYHESVEEEIEQIYADNGVLGAKNLLPNNATSKTVNGVTFIVNDDGSVTASGAATDNIPYLINGYLLNILDVNKRYIYSGSPNTASEQTYFTYIGFKPGNGSFNHEYGSGVEFSLKDKDVDYTNVNYYIFIRSGAILNNIVFKPMLRLASDPDDTYVPHAMTNRELTEEVSNITNTSLTNVIAQPNTITSLGSFTLSKGKYIVTAIVSMSKQTSDFDISISFSKGPSSFGAGRFDSFNGKAPLAANGGIQATKMFNVSSDTTVYIVTNHNHTNELTLYPAVSIAKV